MRDYIAETKTVEQRIGHVVEECGEVCAAAGKTIRWGLNSYNPELPPEKRETNRDWLLREMGDLRRAMTRLETMLRVAPLHPQHVEVEAIKAALSKDLSFDLEEHGYPVRAWLTSLLSEVERLDATLEDIHQCIGGETSEGCPHKLNNDPLIKALQEISALADWDWTPAVIARKALASVFVKES